MVSSSGFEKKLSFVLSVQFIANEQKVSCFHEAKVFTVMKFCKGSL